MTAPEDCLIPVSAVPSGQTRAHRGRGVTDEHPIEH